MMGWGWFTGTPLWQVKILFVFVLLLCHLWQGVGGEGIGRLLRLQSDVTLCFMVEHPKDFSAVFVKYSNKKGHPLKPVYVVLCGVYVSGGFNETWLNVTVNKIPVSS